MNYPEIRNQLGSWLHQDYDLDSGTIIGAIIEAIHHSNLPVFLKEIHRLEDEEDDVVSDVLSDHSLDLWGIIRPRDLLVTMKVLAELYSKEKGEAEKHASNKARDATD